VPENNQVKFTNYTQKHKVCAAAAILCSTIPEKNNLMTIHCGPNALSEFLDKLIVWEEMILKYLRANIPMKALNRNQHTEYDNATHCYLCNKRIEINDP